MSINNIVLINYFATKLHRYNQKIGKETINMINNECRIQVQEMNITEQGTFLQD